jgi:outer membrane protein insertion porin family
MVGKVSFYASAVNNLTDDNVRISKRLTMPSNKLRGFEKGRIGPKDKTEYIGGNYIAAFNIATTLPQLFPSLENFDFSYFIDTGNVWGVDYDSALDGSGQIRSSTGLSIDVVTPLGPMNFSLSQPITKSSSDKTESFRFNLGTTF